MGLPDRLERCERRPDFSRVRAPITTQPSPVAMNRRGTVRVSRRVASRVAGSPDRHRNDHGVAASNSVIPSLGTLTTLDWQQVDDTDGLPASMSGPPPHLPPDRRRHPESRKKERAPVGTRRDQGLVCRMMRGLRRVRGVASARAVFLPVPQAMRPQPRFFQTGHPTTTLSIGSDSVSSD